MSGRYSEVCPHGEELGKCNRCYDIWEKTGKSPDPIGKFGEIKDNCRNPFKEKDCPLFIAKACVLITDMCKANPRK